MHFVIALLTSLAVAREIVFPPTIDISLSGKTPGLPTTINAFSGLTTFANLPYVYCLADSPNEDVEKFDIAFLGAPFDTVSFIGLFVFPCLRGWGVLYWVL
jgi:agmatinase